MESFISEGLHVVNEIPIEDMAYIDASVANPDSSDLVIIEEGSNGKVYRYKNYAIKIFHDVLE